MQLEEAGIEPAPERHRKTSWRAFIKTHWDVLASIDFTTVEVWTTGGLVTYYLLFVMKVATRQIHFAGCTVNPDAAWMLQVGRNITDGLDSFLGGTRYLLTRRAPRPAAPQPGQADRRDLRPLLDALPEPGPQREASVSRWYRRQIIRVDLGPAAAVLEVVGKSLIRQQAEVEPATRGPGLPVPKVTSRDLRTKFLESIVDWLARCV